MRVGGQALGVLILAAFAARSQSPQVSSSVCGECHAAISQSYRATGMARSFFRPAADNRIEDYTSRPYYHAASDTYFEMIEREGKYFQRQYQIGFQGKQANVSENQVDFVMGSGNHARTYLHRTPSNELIELPLGWYAEKGGYWAMNPGYDRPDHAGLSRTVPYACMFCHNGYPEVPAGSGPRANPVFLSVPEGIDCQRCHGDGQKHVLTARRAGAGVEEVRAAIVNPARLPAERRMEVCLQCHLEPNVSSVSNLLVRYERQPFSYQPGEALADFRLHFDLKSEQVKEDRFEVVGSQAWRLMQSQCFLKSNGAMTCTTCHDPHGQIRQEQSCMKCHGATMAALIGEKRHTANPDCAGCHMPKRRTQDAVHVVMTDHLIQKKIPEGDLLAPLTEKVGSDSGSQVAPSYPSTLTRAADELYLGVAQVNEKSTRAEGIARLSAAIAKFRPDAAEYYLQLGDALRASRRFSEAIAPYEEAVRREPQSAAAHERLAWGLTRVQQYARADAEFEQAARLASPETARAAVWKDLGVSCLERGRMTEAARAFEKSLAIDGSQYEAHNGLGGARMKTGDPAAAEAEFTEAIRLRPHYAEAHHNLAYLLSSAGRFEEARYHFEEALHINPNHAETHYDYAVMLTRADLTEKAIEQLRQAVRLDPQFARGNLDLGAALVRSGDSTAARPFLEKAANSGDAAVRAEARKLLDTIP